MLILFPGRRMVKDGVANKKKDRDEAIELDLENTKLDLIKKYNTAEEFHEAELARKWFLLKAVEALNDPEIIYLVHGDAYIDLKDFERKRFICRWGKLLQIHCMYMIN